MDSHDLVKFPRTPHLANLGAATRDDLVFSETDAVRMLAEGVILEEKVDGANLGISFPEPGGPARCQKRGHWVTPASETQFSKLEGWLRTHTEALRAVLGCRYILYGEWAAARHSVPYDCLPDYFLYFDVYDKAERKFLSCERRDALMAPTGLHPVPAVIVNLPAGNTNTAVNAATTPGPTATNAAATDTDTDAESSSGTPFSPRRRRRTAPLTPSRPFENGPVALQQLTRIVLGLRSALCAPGSQQWAEGVYLRQERDGWLVARAKLVNPAFHAAIEGSAASGGEDQAPVTAPATASGSRRGKRGGGSAAATAAAAATTGSSAAAGSGGSGTHWSKRTVVWNILRPDLWAVDEDRDGDEDEHQAEAEVHDRIAVPDSICEDQLKHAVEPTQPSSANVASDTSAAASPVAVPARTARATAPNPRRAAASTSTPASTSISARRTEPSARRAARAITSASRPTSTLRSSSSSSGSRLALCCGGTYIALVGADVDGAAAWALANTDLVPKHFVTCRVRRDGRAHHITLITPPEMSELREAYGMSPREVYDMVLAEMAAGGSSSTVDDPTAAAAEPAHADDIHALGDKAAEAAAAGAAAGAGAWLPLGLGTARCGESGDEAVFLVVAWPAGRAVREALGLNRAREQHFHITLGFDRSDVHSRPKGLEALLQDGRCPLQLLAGADAAATTAMAQAAAAAGAEQVPLHERAAVLVMHTLTHLARTAAPGAVGGSMSPAVHTGLTNMLHIALAWLQPALDATAAAPAAAGATASISSSDGELTGSVPAADPYGCHIVAGAAHVALARLAGRYGEYDQVDEHVRQAEAEAAEAVAVAADGDSDVGAGAVAAAAACLGGKSLSQQGAFAAAASAFERAAAARSRMGLPPASGGAAASLLPLLRQSLEAGTLELAALRSAAAACARRLAKEQQQSDQQQHPQQPQKTQLQPHSGCDTMGQDTHPVAVEDACSGAFEGAQELNPRERVVVPGVLLPAGLAAATAATASAGPATAAASSVAGDVTLMRNTSWLVPGCVMGSSTPKRPEQVWALAALGVGLVVTLTEEEPLPAAWFGASETLHTPRGGGASSASGSAAAAAEAAENDEDAEEAGPGAAVQQGRAGDGAGAGRRPPVANLFVPVPNYEPPSEQQMDAILRRIEEHIHRHFAAAAAAANNSSGVEASRRPGVLVHCGGGKGRAGTVLACYLVKHGQESPLLLQPSGLAVTAASAPQPAMSADAAVRLIRQLRPGSIETEQQRRFVGRYCDLLWRRYDKGAVAAAAAAGGSDHTGDGSGNGEKGAAGCGAGASGSGAGQLSGAGAGAGACSWQRASVPQPSTQAPNSAQATQPPPPPPQPKPQPQPGSQPQSQPVLLQPPGSNYPSTPHLPFSPQVAADDVQLDAAACRGALLGVPLVITEKLDGGNCCIARPWPQQDQQEGQHPPAAAPVQVYARTHKHPATHASFGPIKALATAGGVLDQHLPPGVMLFGENMTAVHSITYAHVPAHFFLFGVWDGRRPHAPWCSWAEVEAWAAALELHTVPVLHRGSFPSLEALERQVAALVSAPSALDGVSPREGVVLRHAAAFGAAGFERCMAKWVRAGHLQTDAGWRRTWRPAVVRPEPPARAAAAATELPAAAAEVEAVEMAQEASGRGEAGPSATAHQPQPPPSPVQAPAQPQPQPESQPQPQASSPPRQQGRQKHPPQQQPKGRSAGGSSSSSASSSASLPRLVVLVGLPGSGKSTFAQALEASGRWSRISQDDCGSRGAAEAAFGAAMLRGPGGGWRAHVVLDRCSPDAADRRAWLQLALVGKRDKGVVAVHFDVPAPVCKARVAARLDHPTIPHGRGGRIVDSFAARLEPPTTSEGFERVFTIHDEHEAEALLSAWGAAGLMRIDLPPPPPPRRLQPWEKGYVEEVEMEEQ